MKDHKKTSTPCQSSSQVISWLGAKLLERSPWLKLNNWELSLDWPLFLQLNPSALEHSQGLVKGLKAEEWFEHLNPSWNLKTGEWQCEGFWVIESAVEELSPWLKQSIADFKTLIISFSGALKASTYESIRTYGQSLAELFQGPAPAEYVLAAQYRLNPHRTLLPRRIERVRQELLGLSQGKTPKKMSPAEANDALSLFGYKNELRGYLESYMELLEFLVGIAAIPEHFDEAPRVKLLDQILEKLGHSDRVFWCNDEAKTELSENLLVEFSLRTGENLKSMGFVGPEHERARNFVRFDHWTQSLLNRRTLDQTIRELRMHPQWVKVKGPLEKDLMLIQDQLRSLEVKLRTRAEGALPTRSRWLPEALYQVMLSKSPFLRLYQSGFIQPYENEESLPSWGLGPLLFSWALGQRVFHRLPFDLLSHQGLDASVIKEFQTEGPPVTELSLGHRAWIAVEKGLKSAEEKLL